MDAQKIQNSIDNLIREVQTLKAYSTRVEKMLEELRGGVGTAQRAQKKEDILREEIREKVRLRFK